MIDGVFFEYMAHVVKLCARRRKSHNGLTQKEEAERAEEMHVVWGHMTPEERELAEGLTDLIHPVNAPREGAPFTQYMEASHKRSVGQSLEVQVIVEQNIALHAEVKELRLTIHEAKSLLVKALRSTGCLTDVLVYIVSANEWLQRADK